MRIFAFSLFIFLIVLLSFFLIGCPASSPAETNRIDAATDRCDIDDSIKQLAADFRRKRSLAGHFSGGPWNPEVDQWMGPKHKLMLKLGLHLGAGGCSRIQVNSLLGPPDQIAHKGDRLFNQIIKLPDYSASTAAADEFMVYFWRGNHDFLFFASQDGVITNSNWYHAGD